MADKDIVRVLRLIEYVGERAWVEDQVERSVRRLNLEPKGYITGTTIGDFPETLGRIFPIEPHDGD